MNYQNLIFINKVKSNIAAFGNKVILIAQMLGINPNWIMFVMNNESGLNHTIKNPNGSATGLIQFTEATAKNLGTTTAALKAMSNVQQLDYVYKYFANWKTSIKNVSDTYLAVFYPLALFKDNSYVFPTWVVQANPIFDLNKDGKLTKQEFINYVNQKYSKIQPTATTTTNTTNKGTDLLFYGLALYGLHLVQKYSRSKKNPLY